MSLVFRVVAWSGFAVALGLTGFFIWQLFRFHRAMADEQRRLNEELEKTVQECRERFAKEVEAERTIRPLP